MDNAAGHSVNKAVDAIQQRLTNYACTLDYDGLTSQAIDAATVRVIDCTPHLCDPAGGNLRIAVHCVIGARSRSS